MAHISGLVDVPEEHPTLRVMPRGTVLLNMDDLGLRFRSLAAFDAWVDELLRLRAPGRIEVSAYHERVQALRAVKGSAS